VKRQGRIVACDGSGKILVELDSIGQCCRCSRGQGCGAGMLDTGQTGLQIWVSDGKPSQARLGKAVLLEIDEHGSGWLLPVFGAYGLPLLGLLLSTMLATFIATFMANSQITPEASGKLLSTVAELSIILSAAAGLCGGIVAWRQLAPGVLARAERHLCFQTARIVATCPPSERELR